MVSLKSSKEIEKLKVSNQMVAHILTILQGKVKPGVTTSELDNLAESLTKQYSAKPAFKGYRGFPYSICASVNSQVVHGFPNSVPLKEGDILSIDFGVLYDGYYGDSALTLPVGEIAPETGRLLQITEDALYLGIEQARYGNRLSDISHAIQSHVELNGCSVVRKFVGHGIGKELHEDPQIPNYGKPGYGIRLQPGMTIAIEPMVNMGGCDVETLEDGWTAVTKDGSLSAHFEHTVAIMDNGPDILSGRDRSFVHGKRRGN
ncbi:MAG: type I methionyl aminopeptidase [Desulfobacterales bacterium C00003106]|jgi:methionyl aminopeptidase|nr:type I methionyl aminopeptidase [Deltaproteobacteria bacterium]OEU56554.1 MAG: type I methionyl aminopeptidase [Desulfobacterales bacterium C00003106]OEU59987.1 MAG: type I methionyl aminopeptidase [Desulfobacterales bacterium C00003104]